MVMLSIVSVMTGCSVATDTPTSAPVIDSHSAGADQLTADRGQAA
jgi:hypothetical protein